jgi:hypothetical protein
MEDPQLRVAIIAAIENLVRHADDPEATLASTEAEILQMFRLSGEDAERTDVLAIVREEIAKARAQRQRSS